MGSLEEIRRYCYKNKSTQRHLVIDTNVLLLLLIGAHDISSIPNCDVTSTYSAKHYGVLLEILKLFNTKVFVTPQVLAEIYSLSKIRTCFLREKWNGYFLSVVRRLEKCGEVHINLSSLIKNEMGVLSFGFTDISIIEATKQLNGVLLTAELPLYHAYYKTIPVIQFRAVTACELQKEKKTSF